MPIDQLPVAQCQEEFVWVLKRYLDTPEQIQAAKSLDKTGVHPERLSSERVYDLVGNLNEWILDPSGTWKGGNYVESSINGDGCF